MSVFPELLIPISTYLLTSLPVSAVATISVDAAVPALLFCTFDCKYEFTSPFIEQGLFERRIFPRAEWGFYQERGIGGQSTPPISKIQRWALAKGLDDSLAFVIARKIARAGYEAQPFVKKTYNWAVGQMRRWFGTMARQIALSYQGPA